jgi:hypothetical protein
MRLENEISAKKEYRIIKILLIIVSLCSLILGTMLLLSVRMREFVTTFAENNIYHGSINHVLFQYILVNDYAITLLILGVLFFCICIGKNIQKIAGHLQRVYLKAKRLPHAQSIILFVLLCLFLFFYVRLNINIMPVITCWTVYRLGFINRLFKKFGKKTTKTAILIACIGIVFSIVIMLLFRVTIVMDLFFDADQYRVLQDFIFVSASHYRLTVHPFYVLFWQSLYHLFCPLVIKSSLSIRIMICTFSGLNSGVFSLFISRITKSRLLNIIVCAIMIFSFPQILHGSQILESFIFTQSSIMLILLYFSFAFCEKKYNLPALLALSLFVTGNNIAYLCIFAIFYIILLCQISKSCLAALNKALRFLFCYIIFFSILLLMQTLFYELSVPSNILFMIRQILYSEGIYISSIPSVSIHYAKTFFNVILFSHLPFNFNMGSIFNHGWIWSLLLLAPVFCFKKISNKPLIIAIVVSCIFLFLFHSFYGGYYFLALYSPVILCIYLSLLAFVVQILPKKMTISLCCLLLAVMIYFNFIGLYTVHCINQYVFGSSDIVYQLDENENNKISMLNEQIENYEGSKILFYRILRRSK